MQSYELFRSNMAKREASFMRRSGGYSLHQPCEYDGSAAWARALIPPHFVVPRGTSKESEPFRGTAVIKTMLVCW